MDDSSMLIGSMGNRGSNQREPFLTPVEVRLIVDGNLDKLREFASTDRVYAVDHKGYTPLHIAASIGNLRVCDLLFRAGCDPKSVNHDGLSPADVAFSKGHIITGQLLSSLDGKLTDNSKSDICHLDVESFTVAEQALASFTEFGIALPSQVIDESELLADEILDFEADEDPESFYERSVRNTITGSFVALTNNVQIDSSEAEEDWNVELCPAIITGDGINTLSTVTPEQTAEHDFLKVGNRGPKPVKRAVIPTSTNFGINPDICLVWAREITEKGWFSTDDIEGLLVYCEGNADFLELRDNLIRALEVAGFEMFDSIGRSEHLLDFIADVSAEDLAEGVIAICNRAIKLPGMGRFDMAKKLDKARFTPIIHAKQELLLGLLECEPVVEEILKTVDTPFLDTVDQGVYSKAAKTLYSWSIEGRVMDGKRRREALMALDTLDLSLKSIKEIVESLISSEVRDLKETQRLGDKISDFEVAIKRVSLEYLPLVRRFSARNVSEGEDPEDVFQVSFLGLYRAALHFDPELGDRFSVYANNGMQHYLNRWRGDEGRIIRLPIHRHENISLIDQAIEKLDAIHCRPPTEAELTRELDWNLGEVRKYLSIPRFSTSPDSLGEWETIFYQTHEEDVKIKSSPLEHTTTASLREITQHSLCSLTAREAKVLRMRFGIGMNTDYTLEEIGKRFDVTRERIRQIEAKALKKLRHPSRAEHLRSFLDIE